MSNTISEIIEPNLYSDDGTINSKYVSEVSKIIKESGVL